MSTKADAFGHKTRYSDSSLYDEVCTLCGATDARGNDALQRPCPCAEKPSRRAAAADDPGAVIRLRPETHNGMVIMVTDPDGAWCHYSAHERIVSDLREQLKTVLDREAATYRRQEDKMDRAFAEGMARVEAIRRSGDWQPTFVYSAPEKDPDGWARLFARLRPGWWLAPMLMLTILFWTILLGRAFGGETYRWSPESHVTIRPSTRPGIEAEVLFLNAGVHDYAQETVFVEVGGLRVGVTITTNTLGADDTITVTPPSGYVAVPPELTVPEDGAGVILIIQDVAA